MPQTRLGLLMRVLGVLCASASLSAQALTLGQLTVESALGEPLRAAIAITHYQVDDLRKLQVQLADPATFAQAGMAFHPSLAGLQAQLEFRGDGQPYVALTGQAPVKDHFVDMIVEARWPAGRLAMNYTLLVSPVGARRPARAEDNTRPTDKAILAPVVPVQALHERPHSARKAIEVQAGDTASKLVLRHSSGRATLEQMLVAMVRTNPEAFIEGNVNLIRAGTPIHMPTEEEAMQVPAEEARQTVIAQTVDFAAYARRLAQNAPKTQASSRSDMVGVVSPMAPPPTPVLSEQDKLTLSKPQINAQNAEAQLAIEREIQDMAQQLEALKKNLDALKNLSAQASPTATPEPSKTLQPMTPQAATEQSASTWLEQLRQSPALWVWVLALWAAMATLVWAMRRRRTPPQDLFGHAHAPAATGLPPQFASLNLDLTPPERGTSDQPQAASPLNHP